MKSLSAFLTIILLTGCATTTPMKTVPYVDLPKFMGDWYVIGTIPWIVEKNNVGTMDIYKPRADGRIDVIYAFHKKSLDAPREEWRAIGEVVNRKTNAEWTVQFIWPFKAPYLIIDLADDYRYTVIGHPSRNLVWIMAREPRMSEKDYQAILARLTAQGYDTSRIVKVPQRAGS